MDGFEEEFKEEAEYVQKASRLLAMINNIMYGGDHTPKINVEDKTDDDIAKYMDKLTSAITMDLAVRSEIIKQLFFTLMPRFYRTGDAEILRNRGNALDKAIKTMLSEVLSWRSDITGEDGTAYVSAKKLVEEFKKCFPDSVADYVANYTVTVGQEESED